MAKSAIKVTRKDTGYGALLKRLGAKGQGEVTIGVHQAEGAQVYEDGETTVADVAAINEFGGPQNNPPKRSWLRAPMKKNQTKYQKGLTKLMQGVVTGTVPSREVALQRLGMLAVSDLQQNIRSGIAPGNAESTKKRKGSSTPLIDEGIFWGSIDYRVDGKKS